MKFSASVCEILLIIFVTASIDEKSRKSSKQWKKWLKAVRDASNPEGPAYKNFWD